MLAFFFYVPQTVGIEINVPIAQEHRIAEERAVNLYNALVDDTNNKE
jgi:hypothetical protein